VEDDARSIALAGAKPADTVPHIDTVDSASALDRPVVNCKDHRITLAQRNDLGSGLHSGSLFSEDKLAANKVAAWLGQENGDLEGKDVFAVEVLVKAVEIPLPVLQKQWRWAGLTSGVATFQKAVQGCGIACIQLERRVPVIRDGRKTRVELVPQAIRNRRQGIAEVFVFTAPEAVARHDDTASERGVEWI